MSRVCKLAVNAADHLIEKERWNAAASILQNYLSSHPQNSGNPEVLRRLGKVRLAQGEPQEAAQLFEKALTSYREAQTNIPTDTSSDSLAKND